MGNKSCFYPSSFPPLEDFDIFTGAIDKTPVKGTYTDLQSQIDATPEGGVLNLPYNFTYNLEADGDNFPNGVILNKTITINGNGYSISGNNSKRVFYVDQTELSIKLNNITFINGNATDGGAIYTYDSNWYSIDVFIDSCTFINNTASVDGGAICMAQGSYNFTVNKCTFINNTASTTNGGAIYYGGDGNELYLTDSIFEGNAANGLANSLYVTSSYVYLENNKINKTFAEIVFDGSYTNKANITVLENKSVFVNGGETVQLNATVTDNEGNLILRWSGGKGPISDKKVTSGCDMIDKWKAITSYASYDHAGQPDKDGMRKVLRGTACIPAKRDSD